MKKYNNKKRVSKPIILLVFLVIVFFGSFYMFKTNGAIFLKYISYPYMYISDFIKNFDDNKKLNLKNSYLQQENLKLQIKLDQLKTIEEEVNYLKEQLNLNNIYSSYDIINSTIITKEDYYFNTIIIDKGKDYNIKENSTVVSNTGLIGVIKEVYDKTSLVKLLSTDQKISVKIIGEDNIYYDMITKIDDNKYVLEGLNYDYVKEDSYVYTTGYGIFPDGIYIGKIKKKDNLYVEKDNINNIKYVAVLNKKLND